MQTKRSLFLERFEALVVARQLPKVPTWFAPPWPEDNAIASWLDVAQARCMRVEEAEPGDLSLDFFFKSAGSSGELTELFLRAEHVHERVELVAQVYTAWFLDGATVAALDARLEALCASNQSS